MGNAEQPEYEEERISEVLAGHFGELEVMVSIDGLDIRLTGTVANDHRRGEVERVVAEIYPDHRVVNRLTVVPVSGSPKEERLP